MAGKTLETSVRLSRYNIEETSCIVDEISWTIIGRVKIGSHHNA